MTQARIKRGSSFKAMFIFDEDEWAALQPLSAISAKFKQGSRETVLAASSSTTARTITLTATPTQTALWIVAPGQFDVWITRGTDLVPVPASSNVSVLVIEGVTQ